MVAYGLEVKGQRGETEMISRAYESGIALANSIVEMANLFYNKRTKANFYKGLMKTLEDKQKRED